MGQMGLLPVRGGCAVGGHRPAILPRVCEKSYSSLREARWLLRARYGSASIEKSMARMFYARRSCTDSRREWRERGDPVIARDGRDHSDRRDRAQREGCDQHRNEWLSPRAEVSHNARLERIKIWQAS